MFMFCSIPLKPDWIMGLEHIRNEIKHMRVQIGRQRREIQQLARAGIATGPAEALLSRMLDKVDALGVERDRLVGEQRVKYAGTDKFIRGTQAAKRGL
jgi:hypothetical protein